MVRILCCNANPEDAETLAFDEEMRDIHNAISPLSKRHFSIQQAGAMRLTDLPRYLLEGCPDIFHFSGHGSKNGELLFEDEQGDAHRVNTETIRQIFQVMGKDIKCVVLSSCYSAFQAKEISKYVPYVIGSTSAIADTVSTKFSATFYQCVSHGKSIPDAFATARSMITTIKSNKSKIFMLRNKTLSDLPQFTLFHPPVILAKFEENKAGNPSRYNTMYELMFWVEHCPPEVLSVNYQLSYENHEYGDEVQNDGLGTEYVEWFYGNLKMRVTLWYQDQGIGYVTSIYNALLRYYSGKRLNPGIRKALMNIKNN